MNLKYLCVEDHAYQWLVPGFPRVLQFPPKDFSRINFYFVLCTSLFYLNICKYLNFRYPTHKSLIKLYSVVLSTPHHRWDSTSKPLGFHLFPLALPPFINHDYSKWYYTYLYLQLLWSFIYFCFDTVNFCVNSLKPLIHLFSLQVRRRIKEVVNRGMCNIICYNHDW
jgi:hypothetical protein